jgi:hypothetical protein
MATTRNKPQFKKCRGTCGRTFDRNEFPQSKHILKDGTVRYYPQAECAQCAVIRVKAYRASKRAANKLTPEQLKTKRKAKRQAHRKYQREYWRMTQTLKGHAFTPRILDPASNIGAAAHMVPSQEFLTWLKLVLTSADVSEAQLARQLSFDASKLRSARNRGTIDLALIDKICTHFGRPDLMQTLVDSS